MKKIGWVQVNVPIELEIGGLESHVFEPILQKSPVEHLCLRVSRNNSLTHGTTELRTRPWHEPSLNPPWFLKTGIFSKMKYIRYYKVPKIPMNSKQQLWHFSGFGFKIIFFWLTAHKSLLRGLSVINQYFDCHWCKLIIIFQPESEPVLQLLPTSVFWCSQSRAEAGSGGNRISFLPTSTCSTWQPRTVEKGVKWDLNAETTSTSPSCVTEPQSPPTLRVEIREATKEVLWNV